jgi:peptidoglycan/LPS O-acetylase OafA/YrhL
MQSLLNRVDVLRFPLVVLVVLVHSHLNPSDMEASSAIGTAQFIQNLLSLEIGALAVPSFFAISGFLFFWPSASISSEVYARKLKSRTRTLLVPYVIWNSLQLIPLLAAAHIPALSAYLSGNTARLFDQDVPTILARVYGMSQMPIVYPMWYVRDLFLMCLLTPLIYGGRRVGFRVVIPFLTLRWFFTDSAQPNPIMPSQEAALFFSLGAYTALSQFDVRNLVDRIFPVLLPVYAVLVIFGAAYPISGAAWYTHKAATFIGVMVALGPFGKALARWPVASKRLTLLGGSATFFVFAAHEPLLTIMRKMLSGLFQPQTTGGVLLLYATLPIVTITLCLLAYAVLKTVVPKFLLGVLTGNRVKARGT